MTAWKAKFLKCLELGTVDASLASYFEKIVDWMRKSKPSIDNDYSQLVNKYGASDLSFRFEEFLDRLLVSDNALAEMFPYNLDEENAKKRYRQLIRVFHPDRGAHDQVWLNYRAERINTSYKEYESRPKLQTAEVVKQSPERSASISEGGLREPIKINTKITYRPSAMRAKLGSAATLQRKIIFALCSCSLLLVLLVFLSNKGVESDSHLSRESLSANTSNAEFENNQLNKNEVVNIESLEISKELLSEAQWLSDDYDDSVSEVSFIETDAGLDDHLDSISSTLAEPVVESPVELKAIDSQSLVLVEPLQALSQDNSDKIVFKNDTKLENDARVVQTLVHQNICDGVSIVDVSDFESNMSVNASNLNVRIGPSKDCEIRNVLDSGTKVKTTKLYNGIELEWVLVSWFSEEQQSWVTGWTSYRHLADAGDANSVSIAKQESNYQENSYQENSYQENNYIEPEAVIDQIPSSSPNIKTRPIPRADNIDQAHEILSKLEEAFETGSALDLIELYMTTGRENNVVGVDHIFDLYRNFFAKTSNRSVVYSIKSYQINDPSQIVVGGDMVAMSIQKNSGRSDISNSEFSIKLVMENNEYKIASFDWQ